QSENGQWKTLFRFNTDEKALADFQAGCDFNQHSPDSHFTQKDLVTIATKDGRTTLSGDELTITSQNEKQKSIVTPDSRATILEKHFGIRDRKSTRLNSSHVSISYAVFCLKKKKKKKPISQLINKKSKTRT